MAANQQYIIEQVYKATGFNITKKSAEEFSKILVRLGVDLDKFGKVMSTNFDAATKKGSLSIQANATQIAKLGFQLETAGGGYKRFNQSIAQGIAPLTGATAAAKSYSQQLADLVQRASLVTIAYTGLRFAISSISRAFSEAIKDAIAYESALAQVQIVSKASDEDIKKLGKSALRIGVEFGTSAKELAGALGTFAQLGFSVNETLAILPKTLQFSIVSGRKLEEVIQDLSAIQTSYNLTSKDTERILDVISVLQLKYAISTAQLAAGLRVLTPVSASFGISLERTAALLTAVQAQTKQTGEEVARGLSSIFGRLQSIDTLNAVRAIAQIPVFMDEAGNATFEFTGRIRSVDDILKDAAKSFERLGESERGQLQVALGGRQQQIVAAATLRQYAESLRATELALNSAGATQEAFDIQAETTEFKIKRLTAAWTEFTTRLIDTGPIKNLLTNLSRVTEAATRAIDVLERNSKRIKVAEEFGFSATDLARDPALIAAIDKAINTRQVFENVTQTLIDRGTPGSKEQLKKDEQAGLKALENEKGLLESLKVIENNSLAIGKSKLTILQEQLDAINKSTLVSAGDLLDKKRALENELNLEKAKQASLVLASKHNIELSKETAFGANAIKLQLIKIKQAQEIVDATERENKLLEEQRKLTELIASRQAQIASELKSTLSGAIKDALLGTGDITTVFDAVANKIKDTIAGSISEAISGAILNVTGIGSALGKLATLIENPMTKAVREGGEKAEAAIDRASENLANAGQRAANAISAAANNLGNSNFQFGGPPAGGALLTNNGQGFSSLGGNFAFGSPPTSTGSVLTNNGQGFANLGGNPVPVSIAKMTSTGASGFSGVFSKLFSGLKTSGGTGIGGAALAGFAGIGAFQNFQQGNTTAGIGGLFQAAGGIASLFPGYGQAIGAGLGIIGTIIGLFQKKKPQVTVQEQTATTQVASRVDVTNKKLDIVNRNLVALKTSFDTFVLPSSAYFSESRNLADQFSINSRRGLIN